MAARKKRTTRKAAAPGGAPRKKTARKVQPVEGVTSARKRVKKLDDLAARGARATTGRRTAPPS
jgi:hypothetical protein